MFVNKRVLQTTREQLFGRLLGGSLGVNRAAEINLDGRRLLGPHVNQIVVASAEIRLLSDGSQCKVVLGVGGGVDEAARKESRVRLQIPLDVGDEHGFQIVESLLVELRIDGAEVLVRRGVVRPHLRRQQQSAESHGPPIAGKEGNVLHGDEPIHVD